MIRRLFNKLMKQNDKILLGRWNLKHNCKSEDIVVLNANRDHCGDLICGDPQKYKELTDLKK
jgi:hypothetical protein